MITTKYTEKYNELIYENNEEYFDEIKRKYSNNKRINILFL